MALGNLLALTRSRTGSPYSIGSIAPHMLNAVMQEQTKGELTAESRSYLPDYETLSKAIIDRDLMAGDKKRYVGALNGLSKRFMSNYKKDPYYAFSQEARTQIRKMQDIATDPLLDAMEQAKKTSDAEFKKAQDNDMDFNPVIEGGRALVQRDGKMQWVPLSQLKQGEDTPLTFTDQYNASMMGGTGGQAIQYDMSDWKTVLDRITTAAANLGEEGFDTQFGNGLMTRTKSQLAAAKARMDWLKQNGFTQADINAIQSEYIKRNGVTDNVLAKSLDWAAKLGDQYITSTADFSQSLGVDPALTAAKTKSDISLTAPEGPKQRIITQGKGNPQAYAFKEGDDPASFKVGAAIDRKLFMTGRRIKDSIYDEGYLPIAMNETLQNLVLNPSEPYRTADNVEIDGHNAIIDPEFEPRTWYDEQGKQFMAIPVLYATDEWNNQAYEDSKYVGVRRADGSFEKSQLGDVGGKSIPEALFTQVRQAINKNDELYPEHLLGAGESDALGGNDDIFRTEIIIEVRPDADRSMRELDDFPHYGTKRSNSFVTPQVEQDKTWVEFQQ